MNDIKLHVKNLSVIFNNQKGSTHGVDDISFTLSKGEILGIVGQSGSGKSITSLSILNLLSSDPDVISQGAIYWRDDNHQINLLDSSEEVLKDIRGLKIGMIFQEPMSSLNPVKTCGWQVKEVLDIHNIDKPENRKQRVLHLFGQVQLNDLDRIYNSYPHELSGGQLQRVNIAMALAGGPDILICDEPTTALDVTIQKEIIELLRHICEHDEIAMIFVSHDLDIVHTFCDNVLVMYQGKIVEKGKLPEVFINPQHNYTKALMASKPNIKDKTVRLASVDEILMGNHWPHERTLVKRSLPDLLISVENLNVDFHTNPLSLFEKKAYFNAVNGVSFKLMKGEALGIVGESGCGKSTLANAIAGLIPYTSGSVHYNNKSINSQSYAEDIDLRRAVQMVFQDPYSTLNPKMLIENCVMEPIRQYNPSGNSDTKIKAHQLLEQVGIAPTEFGKYPNQLSGGQRQRVAIARSLAVDPQLLICDEIVSALDVSVQAQILNLLDDLKNQMGLTIILISHDLSVVHYLCDNILVMHQGKTVEYGTSTQIVNDPKSNYTRSLVESIPTSI